MLGTDEYFGDDEPMRGVFEESALENIKLPSMLRRIEYSAFKSCKNLKSIDLPEKIEYIGKECF